MSEFEISLESVHKNILSTIKSEVSKLAKGMEAIEDMRTSIVQLGDDVRCIKTIIQTLLTTTETENGFPKVVNSKVTLLKSRAGFDATNDILETPKIKSNGNSNGKIISHDKNSLDHSNYSEKDTIHLEKNGDLMKEALRLPQDFESQCGHKSALQMLSAQAINSSRRSAEQIADDHSSLRRARLAALRRRFEQETEGIVSVSSLFRKLGKCELRSLGRDFARSVFGIRPRNTALGIEGSRLIEPTSPFHAAFEILSACMLVYSAFIVPIQLTFWNVDDPCWAYPTLYFDMFVDVFFLFESFYSLFVGVLDSKGNYEDSFPRVLVINLTAPDRFWFNLCTSTPVSWLDWYVIQLCSRDGGGSPFGFNAALLRIAKPLRLIKLVRLLRSARPARFHCLPADGINAPPATCIAGHLRFSSRSVIEPEYFLLRRSSKTYVMMLDALDINPILPRIFKIFCVLAISMHICSCIFWVVKMSSPADAVEEWLADRSLELSDKAGCYLVCIYCISTVFTTVGFGDIYATNGTPYDHCMIALHIIVSNLLL